MLPKAIELEAPKQYKFAYLHSSEAERFSIAVLSTAMEKIISLCDLCVSSPARGGTGGDIFLTHLPE